MLLSSFNLFFCHGGRVFSTGIVIPDQVLLQTDFWLDAMTTQHAAVRASVLMHDPDVTQHALIERKFPSADFAWKKRFFRIPPAVTPVKHILKNDTDKWVID